MPEKVVLAYSGGLDTSIIIPWLKENYSYDVIAMVGDVGQGDDIEAVVEKAYKTGASKVVVKDLREEFLTGYVFPTLKAGAVYEHKYLLGTSMARPVIAKHQVEVALRRRSDRRRSRMHRQGQRSGPLRTRVPGARAGAESHCAVARVGSEIARRLPRLCREARTLPSPPAATKIHSRDRNLWHISHEGGELEDAGNAPLDTTWQISRSPKEAPDREEQGRDRLRKGNSGFGERHEAGSGGAGRTAERNRRTQRRRPDRHRGEPLRGNQVPRLLRNSGRHVADRRRIANSKLLCLTAKFRTSSSTSA